MRKNLKAGSYDVSILPHGEIAEVAASRDGKVLYEATVSCPFYAVPIVFLDGDKKVVILVAPSGKSFVMRDGTTLHSAGKGDFDFFAVAHRALGSKWDREWLKHLSQTANDVLFSGFLAFAFSSSFAAGFSWDSWLFFFLIWEGFFVLVNGLKQRSTLSSLRKALEKSPF